MTASAAEPAIFNGLLKFCKQIDPKLLKRFKREVSLLDSFRGNQMVIQIVASNIHHSPPYYVMQYYPEGDLTNRTASIRSDPAAQEQLFFKMIDCVGELHQRSVFHRDIKPQNFLSNGSQVVISDLGLSVELDSQSTTLTSTAEAFGTYGYVPPEYVRDGFGSPDAAGDVFMLGKAFYSLLLIPA